MAQDTHFDLVRETLKALSERKLVATPDNYQRVYDEMLAHHPTGADDATLRDALLRLLMLIVDNMTVLTADETWIHGQMMALRRATDSFDKSINRDSVGASWLACSRLMAWGRRFMTG